MGGANDRDASDVPKPGVSVSAAHGSPGVDKEDGGDIANGRPGGDKEDDGGDIAKITAMAAAVPGLPLKGADCGPSCGGSGEGIASREGAAATQKAESCPQQKGGGDGGRLRGAGTGGVMTRAVDDTAVERETNRGDCVEVGIGGVEDQQKRDCSISCREQGVDERVGAGRKPGDVAAGGARPPAAWTSSKRPRKEETNAAAMV